MNQNPLVSIIIPVYNGSNFIKEAIDSALAQTYKNIEIIVVNDGSNDEGQTEEIVREYGDKLRYFRKENGGVSTALNLGIANMQGEYFSWLSHDDKYEPNKIQNQIDLLNTFDDPNLIAICASRRIDKDSRYLEKETKIKGLSIGKINTWNKVMERLFINGAFNGCAFLIPKQVFYQCGMFDENLRYSQDALMWYKIFLKKYNLVYQNIPNSLNRVHNRQLTQTGRDFFQKDSEKIADWIIPELLIEPKYGGKLLYLYAKRNAKMGNTNVVERCKKAAKEKKWFSVKKKLILQVTILYGKIRPLIRKIYYRVCKKVKI